VLQQQPRSGYSVVPHHGGGRESVLVQYLFEPHEIVHVDRCHLLGHRVGGIPPQPNILISIRH
jgi:hypothetical protein